MGKARQVLSDESCGSGVCSMDLECPSRPAWNPFGKLVSSRWASVCW